MAGQKPVGSDTLKLCHPCLYRHVALLYLAGLEDLAAERVEREAEGGQDCWAMKQVNDPGAQDPCDAKFEPMHGVLASH